MEIRPADARDVDAVVELWQRHGGPTRHAGGRTDVTRLLDLDPGALLVAGDPDVIGTLIVGWDGWRCHLYRLVVAPEARRRGVATQLVAAAHRRAQARGAHRLDASVDPDNEPAARFWDAAGFSIDHDRRWSRPL